ncbi:MAG: metallophosphoesterase family protein [Cellulosilyticaceae bacterium]
MRYVLSDIHGHYEKFIGLLERIKFTEADTLYILGDMIDRGDEPMRVVQYIMKMPNVEVLRGNHENLMLDVLADPNDEKARERWYRNGGEVTYEQYKELPVEEQTSVLQFLESLPLYKTLEDYVLVHAGIQPPEEMCKWEDIATSQTMRDLTWIRDEFINYPTHIDKKVIFGHSQTFKMGESGSIWFSEDKIGIDCGVYSYDKGGRLGCLCLDTLEAYYL